MKPYDMGKIRQHVVFEHTYLIRYVNAQGCTLTSIRNIQTNCFLKNFQYVYLTLICISSALIDFKQVYLDI